MPCSAQIHTHERHASTSDKFAEAPLPTGSSHPAFSHHTYHMIITQHGSCLKLLGSCRGTSMHSQILELA